MNVQIYVFQCADCVSGGDVGGGIVHPHLRIEICLVIPRELEVGPLGHLFVHNDGVATHHIAHRIGLMRRQRLAVPDQEFIPAPVVAAERLWVVK